VLAENGKFVPAQLTATANVPLTIVLNNTDVDLAHDIEFIRDGVEVAGSELIIGPAQTTMTFTPSAGTYTISCSVHPRTMGGRLTVQ
jgi:plastocyanin